VSTEPVHIAEGDTPMRDGYAYTSTGVGVRQYLVDAVLAKWASVDPYGDPSGPLKNVNDCLLNKVGNLARMAVEATLTALGQIEEG
jgi:hypothetical protein